MILIYPQSFIVATDMLKQKTETSFVTYSKNFVIFSRLQLDQDQGLESKLNEGAIRC